eukprot:CAMPEP_0114548118 /NCGR_PEP_ID=MMETSP0114-20121206/4811_1 /TAXON_ID=31324 /ORGANISM="Goniomonas sp, Strain m" /LENGTH=67 /DNA_ID=CAMNT_0001732687 /DNA_START=22 /DNA_END=225 /DNA_ORIENTATION=+
MFSELAADPIPGNGPVGKWHKWCPGCKNDYPVYAHGKPTKNASAGVIKAIKAARAVQEALPVYASFQ